MTESWQQIMAEQMAGLQEAEPAQVAELLTAMEEFDRAGGGQAEVILPPTVAKYVEPFFETPSVIPATLSLKPYLKPDQITSDAYIVPLQRLVYDAELPSSATVTTDGRFGGPHAIFTYTPIYPIPGKEEDHDALFLERSGVIQQIEVKGYGAFNNPLEEVVFEKTGNRLFPHVSYKEVLLSSRESRPSYAQVLHHNLRMSLAVSPQEAKEVIHNLRTATAARG